MDALYAGITRKKVDWVLDLDIRSFFDKISHEWLGKFVEHRIQDKRVVRLIRKWLKAGVMEQGQWHGTEEGTPQGAVISPILANLYLHYVLDVWADVWRKKLAQGDVIIVRYADDAVLGFQYREEAEKFLEQLRGRLRKFGLHSHLWDESPDGPVRCATDNHRQAHGRQAPGNPEPTAAAHARGDREHSGVAAEGGTRILSIPCHSG